MDVDLGALRHNARRIQAHVGPSCGVVAVVKADAYGLGIAGVVPALAESGIRRFAVVSLAEAEAVRAQVPYDVLIMSHLDPDELVRAVQLGFVISWFDDAQTEGLQQAARGTGKSARVQLKVETGMNRLGMTPAEAIARVNQARESELQIEAVFSHLAMSHDPEASRRQLRMIEPVWEVARRAGRSVERHLTNSHGLTAFSEGHFDFVRVGIALYGVEPLVEGLRPVVSVKSKVIQVKALKPGDGVSYNHRFVADRPMRMAVVSIGYAEGLSQSLTGTARVLVGGQSVPVIGQICMNLICTDVSDIAAQAGDEVVVIGNQGEAQISVEQMTQWAGIRHHEVLTRFGKSLPKRYRDRSE